jgi:O-antigen/teichoic acid export membrane protein
VSALARVSFGALRAHKRSLAATVSRDIGSRIGALLVFGVFVYAGEAFFGAVAYWVMTPLIMFLLAGYFVHTELSLGRVFSRVPDRDVARELWEFSWPLALGASFFLLLSNVDVLMIGYFMDPQSVGLYRAVQPLRQITTFVLVAFTFLFLPIATEYYDNDEIEALNQLYTVSTKWIVAITYPPVLLFTLFASDVVRVLFGADYTAASPALAVLTAGLFLRTLVGLNGDMTKAIGRPKIELYSVPVAVLFNIGLNFLLIPQYGIVGAALGTVVGYAVYNFIEVAGIYWIVGSHPFSTNSLKPLVPTLLVGIGLTQLTGDVRLSLVTIAAIAIILSIIHVFSIIVTRSLSRADLILVEQFEEQTNLDLGRLKSFLRTYYQGPSD